MRCIIIGSGPNGLAAAFYLARAGVTPVVLERRDIVGGGAITGEVHPGFRAPVLSHEVLLHERVVREMNLRSHGLELLPTDLDVCAPSLDGPPIVIYRDPVRTAEGLARTNPSDARAWPGWRAAVTRLAGVLAPLLEVPAPDIDAPGGRDLLELLKAGRRFRALGKSDSYRLLRWLPMPVADLVHEMFAGDLLRATVAAPGVSGTMLGPRSAGSSLVLMLREAHGLLAGGRLQAKGGPGAVTQAMAAAARAAGAVVRTGTPVDRIVTRNGRAAGVVAAGQLIDADVVVSAVDPKTTLLRLVDGTDLTPDIRQKARNYRAAGTMAKVNLALAALPAFRGIHPSALTGRVHIGPHPDYLERAFDHVKYGESSAEPWLEMTLPSILDAGLAPPGGHVASIYVHCVPYRLRSTEPAAENERTLQRVLAVLERYAPGVSSSVVGAQVVGPADMEAEYGFAGGHPFHGELTPDQLFTMRPIIGFARYASPIEGLYFASGGTHPGGFMTGASGRLAAQEIARAKSR